jgi:hypothetical protein
MKTQFTLRWFFTNEPAHAPQGDWRGANAVKNTSICSAAAFGLLGWFLIAPGFTDWTRLQLSKQDPGSASGSDFFVFSPVKNWDTLRTFDTPMQCDDARASLQQKNDPLPGAEAKTLTQFQARFAQCIVSDDPRLDSN